MQMPQNSIGTVHVHNSLRICTLLLQATQHLLAANTDAREEVELPHHHRARNLWLFLPQQGHFFR